MGFLVGPRGSHHVRVIVREARAADLDRVAQIKVDSWRDTYRPLLEPSTLAPFLDLEAQEAYVREAASSAGTLLLVAEQDRAVVGFALTYVDREPEPWLESLHVAGGHRSHGVGEALVRATAAALLGHGHSSMRLGVVAGNAGAIRFYERLGAVWAGRERAGWAAEVWHELFRWPDLESLTLPAR